MKRPRDKIRMQIVAKHVKHGYSGTKVHETWKRMKCRCLDSGSDGYANYGARGITVWRPWAEHFLKFLSDVGEPPTPAHSLDRIDPNRGYIPGNVRWATTKQQARNKRTTIYLTVFGECKPLAEWADDESCPVSRVLIWKRVKCGWDHAVAVFMPSEKAA